MGRFNIGEIYHSAKYGDAEVVATHDDRRGATLRYVESGRTSTFTIGWFDMCSPGFWKKVR
jgi:hypothetical protein